MIKYKQVILEKAIRQDRAITTTHIPSKMAILGNIIKIKINDKWSNGWKIIHVGSLEIEESCVNERSQDYKRTRKASDI